MTEDKESTDVERGIEGDKEQGNPTEGIIIDMMDQTLGLLSDGDEGDLPSKAVYLSREALRDIIRAEVRAYLEEMAKGAQAENPSSDMGIQYPDMPIGSPRN